MAKTTKITTIKTGNTFSGLGYDIKAKPIKQPVPKKKITPMEIAEK